MVSCHYGSRMYIFGGFDVANAVDWYTLMRIQTIPHGLSITRLCLKQILWSYFGESQQCRRLYLYLHTVEINRPDSTLDEVNATVYSQSGDRCW